MSKKLKVLISAYACEPNKGSEPEVGWQWAMQMAKHHDVTVLTRTNNRDSIEKELAAMGGGPASLRFVYHDLGKTFLRLKRRFKATRAYYMLWQSTARKVVQRLHRENTFDLLHHVTIAGFRYETAIGKHGVPTIWGPVGGAESIPWRLLPWKHPFSLIPEVFRNINNFVQTAPFHRLPNRAMTATISLVSTFEMKEAFEWLGLEATLIPTIGLPTPAPVSRQVKKSSEPLKLLFVGNVITLKGIDLAIEALKESGLNASFTLIGDGQYMAAGKKLTKRLGLEKQVDLRGRVPRLQTLKVYPEFDVFVFPSLHDSGGYAVIEAMACGVPVICLDCGGPRVAVKDGAGIRIPLGSRKDVISDMAAAFRKYDADRELLVKHGHAAWQIICRDYDWNIKGRQLDAIYQKAVLS